MFKHVQNHHPLQAPIKPQNHNLVPLPDPYTLIQHTLLLIPLTCFLLLYIACLCGLLFYCFTT